MIKISIVVACRNEQKDIGRCLDAIAFQSYPKENFEAIFVDGKSTDGTKRIILSFKKRIKNLILAMEKGVNLSAANARNMGARIAKGEVIAFFDADTLPGENYLSEIMKAYDKLGFDAASSNVASFPTKSLWANLREHETMASDYLVKTGEGTMFPNIFRKRAFLAIGGYDPVFRYGEDLVLLQTIREKKMALLHLEKAKIMHKDPDSLGEIASQSRFWGGGFYKLFRSNPPKNLPRLMLVLARALWLPLFLVYLALPFNLLLFMVAIFYFATLIDGIIVGYRSLKMGGNLGHATLLIPFRMIRSFYFLEGFCIEAMK